MKSISMGGVLAVGKILLWMISEITLAMVKGVGLGSFTEVIHPYPTQAEAIKAAAGLYTRTRLTPFVKRLFDRWMAISR